MRLVTGWATPLVLSMMLAVPAALSAANCTTQSEMTAPDRNTLASAAQRLATAVIQQDFSTLQGALLPAVAQEWTGMQEAVNQSAATLKGGQPQLRNLYVLDATGQASPADTQFFCSNSAGSLTVTISMRSLPPGKYALVLADAPGSALAGQMAFILASDANTWKLGGLFIRPGMLGGHDGVYYWEQARSAARTNSPWAAYYLYDLARYLLLPVDILSSPNLEKLDQEQQQIKAPPFPYEVTSGDRTWKIDAVRFDPSLRQADLGITYQSAGVTEPAAQRTEAIALLSAFLKAQPALRQSFHGLWAYAEANGKTNPVMELPMNQIP